MFYEKAGSGRYAENVLEMRRWKVHPPASMPPHAGWLAACWVCRTCRALQLVTGRCTPAWLQTARPLQRPGGTDSCVNTRQRSMWLSTRLLPLLQMARQYTLCRARRQSICVRYEDVLRDPLAWLRSLQRAFNLTTRPAFPTSVRAPLVTCRLEAGGFAWLPAPPAGGAPPCTACRLCMGVLAGLCASGLHHDASAA